MKQEIIKMCLVPYILGTSGNANKIDMAFRRHRVTNIEHSYKNLTIIGNSSAKIVSEFKLNQSFLRKICSFL